MKIKRRLRPIETAMLVVPLGALAFASWRMRNAPKPVFVSRYSIEDLGSANPAGSWISDMNNKGELVGSLGKTSESSRPIVWRNGKMNYLSHKVGAATAINDSGSIVVNLGPTVYKRSAFLMQNGKLLPLSPSGQIQSYATDINNSGVIVGYADLLKTGKKPSRAFIWKNGRMKSIALPESSSSQANAINDQNIIVGSANWNRSLSTAVMWKELQSSIINADGGAVDVNVSGTVLGRIAIWTQGKRESFISDDKIQVTFAECINDKNQVVGIAQDNTGVPRIFAFIAHDRVVHDLNDLLDTSSNWYLTAATAINNRGQIAGNGKLNGRQRFFLLTPQVPVTSSTR